MDKRKMIETIRQYWLADISTLPTKENKAPDVKDTWKGGVTDIAAYERAHGVGLVCGEPSGNLEALDFDNHFGDAKDILSAFMEEGRDILLKYKLPIETSMNGGYHLVWRCDVIGGNQKLAQRGVWDEASRKHRPDAIIETRGEGGYFVAAPTPGYRVIRNSLLDIPVISIEDRKTLMDIAKSFNEWAEPVLKYEEQSERPGDKFNKDITSVEQAKESLRRSGWDEIGGDKWRRPRKKDGVSATFGKAAEGIFYNFSANGYPFEPQKGYTAFQVVALLDYSGDFGKFASYLAERYNTEKPKQKEYGKTPDRTLETTKMDDILKKSAIDFSIPVEKPPIAIKIINHYVNSSVEQRMLTLGNFSAIKGKSKSKKTFFTTLIMAAATKNGILENKLIGTLPQNKNNVILFDTEQSLYDAWQSSNRVNRLIGGVHPNFKAHDLREYTPLERCQIIEYCLEKYAGSAGLVVIDGIADLTNANNDEDEAVRVSSLLMKWTAIHQCHIMVVIHENKGDGHATGHIGSYITKKCEAVISVTKDDLDFDKSEIKCDMIRGVRDFDSFSIEVRDGLPYIITATYNRHEYSVKEEVPF